MSRLCEATTRQGTPCELPAGWGTDHVGEGRCRKHGGNAGRPIIHGRYSLKHRASLQAKADEFLSDAAPSDLSSELALARALLQDYLERYNEGMPIPVEEIERIMGMIETISKLTERIMRMLQQTALTQAELELFVVTIADLVVKYVDDPTRRDAFIREAQNIAGRVAPNLGAYHSIGAGGHR